MYCPKCQELYQSSKRYATLDGAYFGTTFPHMLFMAHPTLLPLPTTKEETKYVLYRYVHISRLVIDVVCEVI